MLLYFNVIILLFQVELNLNIHFDFYHAKDLLKLTTIGAYREDVIKNVLIN